MGQKSPCQLLRSLKRMAKYNKMKQEHNSRVLSISNSQRIDIPPKVKILTKFQSSSISIPPESKPVSFASLATPPEVVIQEFIPKLRNMKIELEFTLTEACDHRDLIDLKHEHIRSLSYIISRMQRLRPH